MSGVCPECGIEYAKHSTNWCLPGSVCRGRLPGGADFEKCVRPMGHFGNHVTETGEVWTGPRIP